MEGQLHPGKEHARCLPNVMKLIMYDAPGMKMAIMQYVIPFMTLGYANGYYAICYPFQWLLCNRLSAASGC